MLQGKRSTGHFISYDGNKSEFHVHPDACGLFQLLSHTIRFSCLFEGFPSVVILPGQLFIPRCPIGYWWAMIMREASHIFNPCDLSVANKIRSVHDGCIGSVWASTFIEARSFLAHASEISISSHQALVVFKRVHCGFKGWSSAAVGFVWLVFYLINGGNETPWET